LDRGRPRKRWQRVDAGTVQTTKSMADDDDDDDDDDTAGFLDSAAHCSVEWAGYRSWCSDLPRAGWCGKRMPVGAIFSAPLQTHPLVHPASYTMVTWYLSWG